MNRTIKGLGYTIEGDEWLSEVGIGTIESIWAQQEERIAELKNEYKHAVQVALEYQKVIAAQAEWISFYKQSFDEIQKVVNEQATENVRLQEALEWIANADNHGKSCLSDPTKAQIMDWAREVLQSTRQETNGACESTVGALCGDNIAPVKNRAPVAPDGGRGGVGVATLNPPDQSSTPRQETNGLAGRTPAEEEASGAPQGDGKLKPVSGHGEGITQGCGPLSSQEQRRRTLPDASTTVRQISNVPASAASSAEASTETGRTGRPLSKPEPDGAGATLQPTGQGETPSVPASTTVQETCPLCNSPLDRHFDGSQTYVTCGVCPFDALIGDGDQRKQAAQETYTCEDGSGISCTACLAKGYT